MPLLHSLLRKITGPRCPVTLDRKQWIEERMRWLQREFGTNRPDVPPLLPTLSIFPRQWNGTPEECEALLGHLCEYMEIPRSSIRVNLYRDASDPLRFHLPYYESSNRGAAGIYHGRTEGGMFVISIAAEQLARPAALVATICHELGHVHLLGDNRLARGQQDHEPLTDLLAIYFGAGIFMANSAFEFVQWQDGQRQGWRTSRHGYLGEEEIAYALACYAWLRGEADPPWREHVAGNITPHFNDALHYIDKTRDVSLLRDVTREERKLAVNA